MDTRSDGTKELLAQLQVGSHFGHVTQSQIKKLRNKDLSFIENLGRSYNELIIARNSISSEITIAKMEETAHKETIGLLKEVINMGMDVAATRGIIPSQNPPCNIWIHNLEQKCECLHKNITEKNWLLKEANKMITQVIMGFEDIGYELRRKGNSGIASANELKTKFQCNIDNLADRKVFRDDQHDELVRIDAFLLWCVNHYKAFIAKADEVKTSKAFWALQSNRVIGPSDDEIAAAIKVLQNLKDQQDKQQITQARDTIIAP